MPAILLSVSLFGQGNVNIEFGNISAKNFIIEKSPAIDGNADAVIRCDIGVRWG